VSTAPPVRVSVCTPHPIVLAGVVTLLLRHPDRVRLVTPGEPCDVVLYDVMALVDGDDTALRELLRGSGATVLALSHLLRPDLGATALALGVDGVVPLGVDEAGLMAAVVNRPAPPVAAARGAGLTLREEDVLRLVAAGRRNQEIADALFLSINSVKSYLRAAYRKVGATSRSSAVAWALRHGLGADRDAVLRPAHPASSSPCDSTVSRSSVR
jgi:DNA-binding NarL/FixJ family response regulator